MQRYKNLSGDSGVTAYEIGTDNIRIQFKDSTVYLYNYASSGKDNIEQMKKLALLGRGLTTFINKYIREQYALKLK